MNWKQPVVWILFILFIATQSIYLTMVPALSGDEASEGENVVELWAGKRNAFEGERSYIGPFIDYVRMPFVAVLGHTTLALRVVTLLFGLASFWLAWWVFSYLFGEQVSLWMVAAVFFSPMYMLESRISWAITLIPFFTLLTLFFLLRKSAYSPLLAGLAAGLGIHNHVIFAPTAIAVCTSWVIAKLRKPNELLSIVLILIGLSAGISTQFVMLWQDSEGDQGDVNAVASTIGARINNFPTLAPQLISGSSFIARYTGDELRPRVITRITFVIVGLVILGHILTPKRSTVVLWLIATALHLFLLLAIIDRFTLRYFITFCLSLWALAGLGLGTATIRIPRVHQWGSVALATGLAVWMVLMVLLPYQRTGGSTDDFSLGNRTDSANGLVDTRSLFRCIEGQGSVFSENVHILNRLVYRTHSVPQLEVARNMNTAQWLIDYRKEGEEAGELCPELTHFRIQRRSDSE